MYSRCGEAGGLEETCGGEKLPSWCPHDGQRQNGEDEDAKEMGEYWK